MCLLITKPKNKIIPPLYLKTAFDNNPDGAGFSTSQNGELITRKGFFDFNEFYHEFSQCQNNASLIHFRAASAGEINKTNCHPFRITENLAVGYNGTCTNFIIPNHKQSDSFLFTYNVFRPLILESAEVWKNPAFRYLIEQGLGECRAFLMDNTGHFEHFNMNENCIFEDGIIYSNASFRPKIVSKAPNKVLKMSRS